MSKHPIDPLDPAVAALIRRKAAVIARAMTDSAADYDDFVQDLFLALLARRAKYQPARGEPNAFIHTVIEHAAADLLRGRCAEKRRRQHRREKPAENCADPKHGWEEEDRDLVGDVRDAIDRLPAVRRDLARLLLDSLSVSEIAREYRVTRDTVYARIRSVRHQFERDGLRDYLRKESDT